jgi:hypothetical protein
VEQELPTRPENPVVVGFELLDHHENFNFYCKEHECPCCGICNVENHKDCKEVTVLENIIKNIKTSNLFNEIEQLIDELIETIGKIRQNRETNVSAVKEQKILVEKEIRTPRRKIDGLLFFSSEKGQLTRHLFNNHFAKLLNAGGYSLQTAVYLV